jgi:hypothetical protein
MYCWFKYLSSQLTIHPTGENEVSQAAGGITEHRLKARRKNSQNFAIVLCNLLQANKSIDDCHSNK